LAVWIKILWRSETISLMQSCVTSSWLNIASSFSSKSLTRPFSSENRSLTNCWLLASLVLVTPRIFLFVIRIAKKNPRDHEYQTITIGSNLVLFNRTLVVPYEISKVNFHVKKQFLSVCQKRFNQFENINISRTS
jgi:FlaA1/EpsC-like NDP-sugar epimerase